MANPEQNDMKVSSATVRRLRTERGWSQEQLAVLSGLSLRTIQRVEAEGAASRETRTSLAATFDIQLAELAADTLEERHTTEAPPPASFTRYKISAAIAGVACIPAILTFTGILHAGSGWPASLSSMLAIALFIYAGFGWYFTGGVVHPSRARRIVQALFVFAAVLCGFGLASMLTVGSTSIVASAAQIGLVAMLICVTLGFFISRRRTPGNAR